MFGLLKHKTQKPRDKVEFKFKFSNFQAFQVPKGWDKLFVSIIPMETGKSIAKSGKASVRNGSCLWEETVLESTWVSQDDASKDVDEYLLKFVVAMGSVRFGTLGEATVNLAGYMNSRASVPISLQLKKCDHGTFLQVKIQCLTPRKKPRDEQRNYTNLYIDEMNVDYNDIDNKSEVSEDTFTRSVGSSSSNCWDNAYHQEELCREASLSALASRRSVDSLEGFLCKEKLSPRSKLSCIMKDLVGRKDSTGSQNSSYGSCSFNNSSRTNHLGFSSKMSESGCHFQNPRDVDFGQVSSAAVTSPLQNASSSKELLNAAQVTIELLKAEAKMWEQNTQKLMIDLEILRKELSDQSNYQADLVVELSALHTERDSMMSEIEKLKILLEAAKAKQLASEVLAAQNLDKTSRELEYEIKFQKQSNANFSSQLTKSLEANIELVSVLQELEGTLEEQKNEIAYLSLSKSQFEKLQLQKWQESQVLESTIQSLERTVEEKNHEIEIEQGFKIQTLMEWEAEWRGKLQKKEKKIINLEEKLSEALAVHNSTKIDLANGDHPIPSVPIEAVIHVTDSRNDLQTCIAASNSSHLEGLKNGLLTTPDCEVSKLKYQISYLEEELKKKEIIIEGFSANELQNQYKDNENECEEHELQLKAFPDKACFLDGEQCKVCTKEREKEIRIDTLQQKLESCAGKEIRDTDCLPIVYTISYTSVATEMYELFSKLYGQLQLSIAEMKNQQCTLYLPAHNAQTYGSDSYDSSEVFLSEDYIAQNEQVEAILNTFFQLKKLLEAVITLAGDDPQCNEEVVKEKVETVHEFHNEQEGYNLKVNSPSTSSQELKSLHMKLESEATYMSSEMLESILESQNLKAYNMMNEENVKAPQDCKWELETQVVNLRRERSPFEENKTSFPKGNITSKCSDNLQNDIIASANKSLSKKSLEIESDQHELEIHLFELQEENVMLSERICGLEAVLRYMTDERESSRLVLQNAASQAMNLQDEVRSLEAEMEEQKVDMRQKLQDMQQQWSEIREECENLNIAYSELQDINRSLVEECSMLQKSNGDLRKQSMELHELCTVLETELKESQKFFSDTFREVENLEAKCSSILEGITTKERAIISELDALLLQNKTHKEQLAREESMLKQMFLEKKIEVENLQREVGRLTEQIAVTRDGKERRASEAVLEVYRLHTDKTLLEAALQEVQGKLKLYESKFDILQLEYETRVVRLMGELATSKQNRDIMLADHEKVLGLLEDVRSNEEKLENIVVGLKLKLKASENERLQLAEENSCLKVQLQKKKLLQDDALALKRSFSGARIENERLEASFQILSADYEELKAKRISYVQKISIMEKAMSELEDFKRSKVVLEEKVLQLEWDLAAREALHAQVAELKNEVARMKKANNECQRKLRSLEEEKVECMKKAQVPKEEPRQKTEVIQDQTNCNNASCPCFYEPRTISTPIDSMLPQTNEDTNIIPSNGTPKVEINQVQKHSHGQDKVNNTQHSDTRSSQVIGVDPLPKIKNLNNELVEALNSNYRHKAQIESLLSEGLQAHTNEHKTLVDKDGGVTKEGYESKALLLETELWDLRELDYHQSLKYPEVEGHSERLERKLKDFND